MKLFNINGITKIAKIRLKKTIAVIKIYNLFFLFTKKYIEYKILINGVKIKTINPKLIYDNPSRACNPWTRPFNVIEPVLTIEDLEEICFNV